MGWSLYKYACHLQAFLCLVHMFEFQFCLNCPSLSNIIGSPPNLAMVINNNNNININNNINDNNNNPGYRSSPRPPSSTRHTSIFSLQRLGRPSWAERPSQVHADEHKLKKYHFKFNLAFQNAMQSSISKYRHQDEAQFAPTGRQRDARFQTGVVTSLRRESGRTATLSSATSQT